VSVVWTVRHGDTSHSPVWAIVNGDGTALSLAGWTVRAQARAHVDDIKILKEWTQGQGVTIGSSLVRLSSGAKVTTATVQLTLDPADFAYLPRSWSGVFDVEIAQPDSAHPTGPPLRRYTVVADATLTIVPDVTRDDG
jgi:hypothetical protein